MCGALGTILTGFFAVDGGLLYGGGFGLLGVQILGVVAVIAWVVVTMLIIFKAIDATIGLRASEEEETRGLDLTEHGLESSYADFMPTILTGERTSEIPGVSGSVAAEPAMAVPVEKAIEVSHYTAAEKADGVKFTKVVMIFNQAKFAELKETLNGIGITGMTVTQVMGCGTQKGHAKYYRGIELKEISLLPKVKLEVVVSKVPVAEVIDTARKVLYTGHIGDGKIFVYDVEEVVKIRTGETGYDALQGE
jgi:Amt family ammonium transporter